MTASSPSRTHHTALATGRATSRSVRALRTSTSAALVAASSSATEGPNVSQASSLPPALSYHGSNSDTIKQTAPARATSSPTRSRFRLIGISIVGRCSIPIAAGELLLDSRLAPSGLQRVAQQQGDRHRTDAPRNRGDGGG